MYELYQSKEISRIKEKEKMMEINKQFEQSIIKNNINEFKGNGKLEVKKNAKRKFNSNIINPNVKKRDVKGAKFVDEEN